MNRSPSIRNLPFRNLPRQPELFLKYVDGSPEHQSFYRCRPTHAALTDTADQVRRASFPRQEMAGILKRQNEELGSSDAVQRAIEDLEKPDSVAVLTGQQVGLFTGPILTIYKALTALRLSAELRSHGFNSVPIFWMASDDHDLAEITRLTMQGPGPEFHAFDAREMLFGVKELSYRPVGAIRLPETIQNVVAEYFASFPGDWNAELRAQVAWACQPGATFAEAFGRLMARLFRDRGLILFDPRAPAAKKLFAGVIHKALMEARMLRTRLAERGQALKEMGLGPQVAVLPRSTLVFLEDEGERRLLLTGDHDFFFKETGRHYTLEELLDLTVAEPERFSPNVLLRPVVQDHLFPTVAYVGGPAEVSYFAQIEPLYRFFSRLMPAVWPRSSFTVLDPETTSIMERYDLSLEDCFQGKHKVIRQILRAQPARFEVLLAELSREVDQGIAELRPSLVSAEASLGPAADTVRRKLLHRVASLQTKFVNFEMRRNSLLHREVSQALNSCYPRSNLQERELGAYGLLSRLGPSLLDTLFESVDTQAFTHRIVSL